jgi:hypothetical protein
LPPYQLIDSNLTCGDAVIVRARNTIIHFVAGKDGFKS